MSVCVRALMCLCRFINRVVFCGTLPAGDQDQQRLLERRAVLSQLFGAKTTEIDRADLKEVLVFPHPKPTCQIGNNPTMKGKTRTSNMCDWI